MIYHLATSLHLSEHQILITHAQYIFPVTVPSFTPATSNTFTPQTVRTLCITPTTCKVNYDCNTYHHAWSLYQPSLTSYHIYLY